MNNTPNYRNYRGGHLPIRRTFEQRLILERLGNPHKSNIQLARAVARNMLKEKYRMSRVNRNHGIIYKTAANIAGGLRGHQARVWGYSGPMARQYERRLQNLYVIRRVRNMLNRNAWTWTNDEKRFFRNHSDLFSNEFNRMRGVQPRGPKRLRHKLRNAKYAALRKLAYLKWGTIPNAAKLYANLATRLGFVVGKGKSLLHSLANKPRARLATARKRNINSLRALVAN
jgi:hypothetical protein